MRNATEPARAADFRIGEGRDYVRRDLGVRVIHYFYQADGSERACAGPGYCRECNREGRRA